MSQWKLQMVKSDLIQFLCYLSSQSPNATNSVTITTFKQLGKMVYYWINWAITSRKTPTQFFRDLTNPTLFSVRKPISQNLKSHIKSLTSAPPQVCTLQNNVACLCIFTLTVYHKTNRWKIRTASDGNHASTSNTFFLPFFKNCKEKKNEAVKCRATQHWAGSMKHNYRSMNSFVKVVHPFWRSWWWEQKPMKAQTSCANSNIITVSKNWIRPVG